MERRRLSRYWLLVPVLLAVVLARDWIERPDAFVAEETVDMRATEADYYLENFTTRHFGENGALEYVVRGATLAHYPDDDRSEVDAPRVELHRPEALWRGRAARGRLDTGPDVLTLLGDVVLERLARTADAAPEARASPADGSSARAPERLTIRTADLALALESDEITTEAPFEIVAEGWRVEGVGLRSAIDEGKLVLLSEVRGRFDPAPAPETAEQAPENR